MVTLIGPGGAGKSTVGALLAERLRVPFVDLDRCFAERAGDLSDFMCRYGYDAYAHENVAEYLRLTATFHASRVIALSSGFMTYSDGIHAEYRRVRDTVAHHPTTFVLIPSLDCERCVAETVRRQLTRPFARSAAREEAVIRERFPLYLGLTARKVETFRPVAAIVDELAAVLTQSP